jgi:hypothetical protein
MSDEKRQKMKVTIMYFSSSSSTYIHIYYIPWIHKLVQLFLFPRSKYSPQHSVLKCVNLCSWLSARHLITCMEAKQ